MSAYIDIFIKTNESVDRIAAIIGDFCGVDLVVNSSAIGSVYEGNARGMWISIFKPIDLEDDGDIEFSQYPVQVELGPLQEEPVYDEWVRINALSTASHLRTRLNSATMVTYNMQRLIQRFSP